jgi:hypothetical protein
MPIIAKPRNKDFLTPIISELNNLHLYTKNLDHNQLRNKSENICLEYKITDILQNIVDYCNSYYTSFQFELKMV